MGFLWQAVCCRPGRVKRFVGLRRGGGVFASTMLTTGVHRFCSLRFLLRSLSYTRCLDSRLFEGSFRALLGRSGRAFRGPRK